MNRKTLTLLVLTTFLFSTTNIRAESMQIQNNVKDTNNCCYLLQPCRKQHKYKEVLPDFFSKSSYGTKRVILTKKALDYNILQVTTKENVVMFSDLDGILVADYDEKAIPTELVLKLPKKKIKSKKHKGYKSKKKKIKSKKHNKSRKGKKVD